jgi:hypothetical protein
MVILSTSKVLSPQYMIWIVPLAAAVFGFELRWLLLLALTAFIYPLLYETQIHYPLGKTPAYDWPLLAGIAIRNTVLVLITAQLIFRPAASMAAERFGGAVVKVQTLATRRQKIIRQRREALGRAADDIG